MSDSTPKSPAVDLEALEKLANISPLPWKAWPIRGRAHTAQIVSDVNADTVVEAVHVRTAEKLIAAVNALPALISELTELRACRSMMEGAVGALELAVRELTFAGSRDAAERIQTVIDTIEEKSRG